MRRFERHPSLFGFKVTLKSFKHILHSLPTYAKMRPYTSTFPVQSITQPNTPAPVPLSPRGRGASSINSVAPISSSSEGPPPPPVVASPRANAHISSISSTTSSVVPPLQLPSLSSPSTATTVRDSVNTTSRLSIASSSQEPLSPSQPSTARFPSPPATPASRQNSVTPMTPSTPHWGGTGYAPAGTPISLKLEDMWVKWGGRAADFDGKKFKYITIGKFAYFVFFYYGCLRLGLH